MRVWLPKMEEMHKVLAINFDKKQVCFHREGSIDFWASDYILMRSTEEFDKNGVEIYEGDIVKAEDSWREDGLELSIKAIRPIIFKWGALGIQGYGNSQSFFFPDEFHPFDYRDYRSKHFEVIGNLYENPELRKECLT